MVRMLCMHKRKVPDRARETQEAEERRMEEQTHSGDVSVKIEKKKVESKERE